MLGSCWIGVASRDHVLKGVEGGFAQLCHGSAAPLRKMKPGDWLVYYSSKDSMGSRRPCQTFTAVGQIADARIYPYDAGGGTVFYRRKVKYRPCREVSIRPLLDELSFIKDKKRWGYPFRGGHFLISGADFEVIAQAMEIGERRNGNL